MNEYGDPETTLVTIFNPDGTMVLFEIVETPLDVELRGTADGGASIVGGISVLLSLSAHLLPDSTTKYHAFKAAHSLKREASALEDRMTTLAKPSDQELPF